MRSRGAGALVVGAGALFLRNNDLSDPHAAGAERLASMCALALAAALLVGQLAARRSRWPWARSLPWSARRRVLIEASQIALALVPVVVVCVLATPGGALSALAALPFVALRATSQQLLPSRLPPGLRTGLEILPAAALCALVPFFSLILLGLVPVWLRLAVGAERDWAASAWRELEHSAEGDPLLSTVP